MGLFDFNITPAAGESPSRPLPAHRDTADGSDLEEDSSIPDAEEVPLLDSVGSLHYGETNGVSPSEVNGMSGPSAAQGVGIQGHQLTPPVNMPSSTPRGLKAIVFLINIQELDFCKIENLFRNRQHRCKILCLKLRNQFFVCAFREPQTTIF